MLEEVGAPGEGEEEGEEGRVVNVGVVDLFCVVWGGVKKRNRRSLYGP